MRAGHFFRGSLSETSRSPAWQSRRDIEGAAAALTGPRPARPRCRWPSRTSATCRGRGLRQPAQHGARGGGGLPGRGAQARQPPAGVRSDSLRASMTMKCLRWRLRHSWVSTPRKLGFGMTVEAATLSLTFRHPEKPRSKSARLWECLHHQLSHTQGMGAARRDVPGWDRLR
jgi:hypothetical protein